MDRTLVIVGLLLGAAFIVLVAGCVTQSKYDGLADAYDEQQQVTRALDLERQDLLESNEGLRQQVDLLETHNSQLAARAATPQDRDEVTRMVDAALERLATAFETQPVSANAYSPEVERQGDRVIFRFSGDISFASGKAELTAAARNALTRLAREIAGTGEYVRVDGHTDNTPVKQPSTIEKYGDNLGLSAARARAVYDFFVSAGVPAGHCYFAGFGQHFPRASNDNDSGRRANRRVEVFVGSATALGLRR